jgi:stage II sporulation protein D
VAAVGRLALRLAAVCVLVLGGGASSLLAARAGTVRGGVTGTTAATAAAPTVTSTAAAVLAVAGHGFGHGLGMSQWGAYGYAKHGWSYDRILAHYYTGTTLGQATVTTVRVLLQESPQVELSSPVPWTVTDATGTKAKLSAAADVALTAKLKLPRRALVAPLTFASTQPIEVDGRPYRGRIVVSSDGRRLQVVDSVALEAYVKGVVAAEMPSAWPAQALEAQAVATRSYALANLTAGRGFDLYGDTRSQVYGGVAAETPASDAAVDATKGQVVLYAGKVADTLFCSSSGGRTASALEETGTAVPYLVPVADPYDTLSPYHDWGPVLFDAASAARRLKVAGPLEDVQVAAGPSGRARTVTLLGAGGAQRTVTGAQFRAALGLRSTWVEPAVLSLQPRAATMTYGGAASLRGVARGTGAPLSLESSTATQAWTAGAALAPGADGGFATIVRPAVTTWYRLAWGTARVGLARVAVAPRVTAAVTPSGATGAVRPVLAGAAVQLQQRTPTGGWRTVASGVTTSAGAYSFARSLQPGSYRVRCAPGHGLVPGVSPTAALS